MSKVVFLGCIACMQCLCALCSLLLQMSHVALSECLSVCWPYECAVQKRLNQMRCSMGADLGGPKEPCSAERCVIRIDLPTRFRLIDLNRLVSKKILILIHVSSVAGVGIMFFTYCVMLPLIYNTFIR